MKQLYLFVLAGMLGISMSFAQPTIRVWGHPDSLTVENQISRYLDELEVREDIHLTVRFTRHLPEKLKGITLCQHSEAAGTRMVLRVRIDGRLNRAEQAIVLAHEMVHVRQYAKRELVVIDSDRVRWKGRLIDRRFNDFLLSPWEHDARREDHHLARLIKKQPDIPLTALRNLP